MFVFFKARLKESRSWQVHECVLCPGKWAGRGSAPGFFPYLIVIWFVARKRLGVAADSLLAFGSAWLDGFHLSAKFRVMGVEVLVSPWGREMGEGREGRGCENIL